MKCRRCGGKTIRIKHAYGCNYFLCVDCFMTESFGLLVIFDEVEL